MSIPKPYVNNDKNSFAHTSLTKRWPAIIEGAVSDLEHLAAEADDAAKKEDAALIVKKINALKFSMAQNDAIKPLESKDADAAVYNATPEIKGAVHWSDAPWLMSECTLYRKLQQIVEDSEHWKNYDIFGVSKAKTFEQSADAVSTLANRYSAIMQQIAATENGKLETAAKELLFHEFVSTSLWGNATDLSLLVTVSMEELKKLQVAAESRDKESLLANDFPKIWKQVNSQVGGRVDIVLDNSGFELYTDLILSLFLLDTGLAEQIVLHPKNFPWFVSDVVPRDLGIVVQLLSDASKFPNSRTEIELVVSQLRKYMNEGQLFIRTSSFWTTALPYWEIREGGAGGGDAVWRDLRQSKLVIFKGDLNYRKLTGDLMWPRDTPFRQAIRDLADSNIPFVSLRTIKADVCVGLPEGKAEELASKWASTHPNDHPEGWAWSGQYAVVSFNK